jgi:hypothetical protein
MYASNHPHQQQEVTQAMKVLLASLRQHRWCHCLSDGAALCACWESHQHQPQLQLQPLLP